MVTNTDYTILTPSGYSNFNGISKKTVNVIFQIKFDDGTLIKCTENHLIKITDSEFLEACHILAGDTIFGNKFVIDVSYEEGSFEVFDPIDVKLNNEYYSNGVVSHNCAFVSNAEEIWISAQQTLATGGGAIILSTPNGVGNFFHKTWVESETNIDSRFHRIKLPWTVHPDRNQDWRDKQDDLLGARGARQECVDGDSIITIRDVASGNVETIKISDFYTKFSEKMKKYEILTDGGFVTFDTMQCSVHDKYYEIHLSTGRVLKTSLNHKFIVNKKIVLANELSIGDVLYNNVVVNDIIFCNGEIALYDIINAKTHSFIHDTILSHNCDAQFEGTGHTVIEGDLLAWYRKTTVLDPMEKRGFDANIWVWEQPDYSKDYIVVADVARGDGGDYSGFHVIDVETVTQVAEYKGQISPKDYGNMLVNIATEYNDALLVIENANIGWTTIQVAIDRGYKNLYYSPKDSSISDVAQQLSKYVDLKDTSQMVPGFTTSSRTRPLVISKLDMYMRERTPVIRSSRLLDELDVFIWNGSKAEAMRGYNDDLVMSFCIALWIRDTALRLRQQGIEVQRKTLDYFGKHAGVYNTRSGMLKESGWSMNVKNNGKGQLGVEDLTWLL
jgi:hypothetical protein